MLTAEPKGYGSNWYATTRVDGPVRPRLSMELDVEVCVIGAGLAGLTVACEVARNGWSVVVLEAKSIAWSASGRNSGVVLPGFGVNVDNLIERVGLDTTKTLWAMSEAGAAYVRSIARVLPGAALHEEGWLHVSKTDRPAALAHEAAMLAGEFGVVVEPWPADRVREALNSPLYFHGLHYPRAFSVHPLNYALGLATAAEANGARIFEDTPVLEIDPAGVRKRVTTADSRIRAAHVVLAGGVHMGELAPQFNDTLLPVFDTVAISAPLGDELPETIRFPGAISDEAVPAGHHHRVVEGRRLMWCGKSSVHLSNPQQQGKALLRQIRQTYPALGGLKVEHAWVGVAGRTVHGMPQIGEITPGLWLLNGFGGHGINTATMGGEIIARAIVDNDRAWEMFSAFPLVWAGGALGRVAQQVSGWSRGLQDAVGGMLAKRRAAAQLRPSAVQTSTADLSGTILEPLAAAESESARGQPAFAEPLEPRWAQSQSAEQLVAQREFIEPVEDPIFQPAFIEPVRPPAASREVVERIRALVGERKSEAVEPPAAVAAPTPAFARDETSEAPAAEVELSPKPAELNAPAPALAVASEVDPPVVARRPKRGPKRKKPPLLLQPAPQSTGGSTPTKAAALPVSPDEADEARPPFTDKKN